ncbi:MAG TPA: hypothetical protein VGI81_00345 [Tepidisphaeraceae bacterium]
MSEYPPPVGPGDYPTIGYNAGGFVANPRPTSVTMISIFAIVLGSLWLFCGAIGLVMQALIATSGGRNPLMPNLPAMTDLALQVYNVATGVVTLIIAAVLLGAGIGGLKLRPLARRTMLGLSVVILAWATAITVVQIVWVGPKTIEYSHRSQAQMGSPAPALSAGVESGMQIGGAVLGWVIWCTLPVCTLIFWRSARVAAAFEQPPPPMATAVDPNWPRPPNSQTGF